jgi:hypothetical protein
LTVETNLRAEEAVVVEVFVMKKQFDDWFW